MTKIDEDIDGEDGAEEPRTYEVFDSDEADSQGP